MIFRAFLILWPTEIQRASTGWAEGGRTLASHVHSSSTRPGLLGLWLPAEARIEYATEGESRRAAHAWRCHGLQFAAVMSRLPGVPIADLACARIDRL